MSPADPHLHRRPSNTRRQFWVSLLWGHCCSSLGLGACNILFVLSKTTVLVSPSTLEVQQSNPAGPQAQIPWGFQVPLLHPQAGKPDVGSGPSQQWENFFGIIVLQSVGHPPRGYRIDFIVIVPLLLYCYIYFFVFGHGFLFCLFICLFLVTSSVLLLMVVQQIGAILVLLEEEMSTGPSTPPSGIRSPVGGICHWGKGHSSG